MFVGKKLNWISDHLIPGSFYQRSNRNDELGCNTKSYIVGLRRMARKNRVRLAEVAVTSVTVTGKDFPARI